MQENYIYEQLTAVFINRAIKQFKKLFKAKEHQKILEIMGDQELATKIKMIMHHAEWECRALVHKKLSKLEFKEPKQ